MLLITICQDCLNPMYLCGVLGVLRLAYPYCVDDPGLSAHVCPVHVPVHVSVPQASVHVLLISVHVSVPQAPVHISVHVSDPQAPVSVSPLVEV